VPAAGELLRRDGTRSKARTAYGEQRLIYMVLIHAVRQCENFRLLRVDLRHFRPILKPEIG
jgi:hypothetical protein